MTAAGFSIKLCNYCSSNFKQVLYLRNVQWQFIWQIHDIVKLLIGSNNVACKPCQSD